MVANGFQTSPAPFVSIRGISGVFQASFILKLSALLSDSFFAFPYAAVEADTGLG
jgi:hypothetical protein